MQIRQFWAMWSGTIGVSHSLPLPFLVTCAVFVSSAVSMDGRAELLFNVFDTDRNGLVDALELFVTMGLLSGSSCGNFLCLFPMSDE